MDAIYWALAASAGAGAIGVARLATALTRRHRRRRALEVPASVDDPQEWSQRAAAACLAPGGEWSTTLSTTFER